MCLAVPAQIIKIDGDNAQADFGGVKKSISLMLLPEAKVGDYVLVHAGFAMQVVAADYGQELQALREELGYNE